MINIKQIIEAWAIATKPNESQKKLAELRGKICDECPSKKHLFQDNKWGAFCNECGCPIGKKIYTNDYDPCPLNKWHEVDLPFFEKRKTEKTIF